ncbi:MAG: hypothetical protein NVV82_03315 [Sporocytophaga sp.]|nr:hypothetical protein [Sporocytophaga sp.]
MAEITLNKKKIVNFSKLIGSTFLVQCLIQFIGMVLGFFIVRSLTVQEYALYTVANSMLTMLNVLSNSGISTSTYALGGKVWTDKTKLGKVLSTAITFRNKFSLLALLIGIPFTIHMLLKQQASWETIILIIITFIPSFKAQLTDNLYEVVPKLHQDIRLLQGNQLFVAVFRLLLSGLSLFIFPFAWVAFLANGIPRIVGNLRLRNIVEKRANITKEEDSEIKREIKRIVKRTFPGSLYFAFSGQISLFILAYMGKSSDVAEWGAIGRFSVIFSVISSVFAMVIMPRYSRLENNLKKIFITAHKILGAQIILGLLVLSGGYMFSNTLLFLLGKHYQNLNIELLVALSNGAVGIITGTVLAFSIRRGWVIHPAIDIFLNVFPVVLFTWLFSFNSLLSVLLYSLCVQIFVTIAHYLVFLYQLNKNAN